MLLFNHVVLYTLNQLSAHYYHLPNQIHNATNTVLKHELPTLILTNISLTLNCTVMNFMSINVILFSFFMLLSLVTTQVVLTTGKPSESATEFTTPVLKTKGKPSPYCLAPSYMLNAWYEIECVVPFCEEFNPESVKHSIYDTYQFYEKPSEKHPGKYSNSALRLVVDTVQELTMVKKPIWASYLFHHNFLNERSILQDDTLIQEVKSFPVYLANTSADKIANVETQDGSLMMITEARDEKGTWKPVEYWSHSWCGNSYYSLDIKPEHFAFTRGVKCSGDFLTRCRLKLKFNGDSLYSNTFSMNISKGQFTKPDLGR